MNPFFSIIIPAYNRLQVLPDTINSVLAQSFANFEMLVVDDGSTDGTAEWLHCLTDERIKVIYQTNAGVCAARNAGAIAAKGTYLIFLDSDDLVKPNWLLDFFHATCTVYVDLILCKTQIVRKNGNKQQEVLYFLAGAFCVKRIVFFKAGMYDVHLRFGENTELKWRIDKYASNIKTIDAVNLVYQSSGNGGSGDKENQVEHFYYITQKHEAIFRNDKRMARLFWQIAGVNCIKLGRKAEGRRLIWKGFLKQPYHYKALLRVIWYNLLLVDRKIEAN